MALWREDNIVIEGVSFRDGAIPEHHGYAIELRQKITSLKISETASDASVESKSALAGRQ